MIQAVWKNLFKKRKKVKVLNLNEIVQLYKICLPYASNIEESYILAKEVYTVSKDKAVKMYKILFGFPPELDDDEDTICFQIAIGLETNKLNNFYQHMQEVKHGN